MLNGLGYFWKRTHSNGMTSFFVFIFVGLISISGIAINAYIIFVIIKEKQVRCKRNASEDIYFYIYLKRMIWLLQVNSANGMLLVQVSAVELALSVSVIMCSMPFMIFDNQSFPLGYCTMCGFLISFLRPVALWTLCGLNCDRYYAISAPLHYGSLINSRKVRQLKWFHRITTFFFLVFL